MIAGIQTMIAGIQIAGGKTGVTEFPSRIQGDDMRMFRFVLVGLALCSAGFQAQARSVYGIIGVEPLSLLISPDIDGFSVTSRTRWRTATERIEGEGSFTPMLKGGVRFQSRPVIQDIVVGGGILVNDVFNAPIGTLESRTHFRLGRVFSMGPKLGVIMIGEPSWDGVSDVSLSSTAGIDIGLALSIDTRRVAFGVSLSYMALAPLDVETGGGWEASDNELDMSGAAIQLGVRFLL